MNRYPIWKYAIILIALVVGALYALPNFFGEAPAVQVSAAKVTFKVDRSTQTRVEDALKAAGLEADLVALDGNSVKARFGNTDAQLKAKDAIQKALIPDPANPGYVVALNLLSRSCLVDLAACIADVSGAGFARWCAFHAASGHAGRPDQTG
jgi:preprotein translocase subunit SecD